MENPYSGNNISVKPYFANQGFEPDPESGPGPPGELKKFPLGAGTGPVQQNGAADKTRPVLANPYGSIYRSAGGSGPGIGSSEEEVTGRRCPCCRRGGCCACCRLCIIS